MRTRKRLETTVRFLAYSVRHDGSWKTFLRVVGYSAGRLVRRRRQTVLVADCTQAGRDLAQANDAFVFEVVRHRRRVEEYLSMVENPADARYWAMQYREGDWVVGATSALSGEPVGCLFLRTNVTMPGELASRTGKGAYVYGLCTRRANQRQGIALASLLKARAELSKAGYDYLWVKVKRGNVPALRCYAKAGFRTIGRQTRWFVLRRQVYSRYGG